MLRHRGQRSPGPSIDPLLPLGKPVRLQPACSQRRLASWEPYSSTCRRLTMLAVAGAGFEPATSGL